MDNEIDTMAPIPFEPDVPPFSRAKLHPAEIYSDIPTITQDY